MDKEELKRLSPEERIKRLRDLEDERRQEIEEARKLIRDSEEELADQQEKRRQVPIPQVAAPSIDQLFSAEEKDVYAAKRFVRVRESGAGRTVEIEQEAEPELELEAEVLEQEGRLAAEAEQRQYQVPAMEEPGELYARQAEVYAMAKQDMDEHGYLTQQTREEVKSMYEQTRPDAVAQEADATQSMMKQLMEWYRG